MQAQVRNYKQQEEIRALQQQLVSQQHNMSLLTAEMRSLEAVHTEMMQQLATAKQWTQSAQEPTDDVDQPEDTDPLPNLTHVMCACGCL